MKFIYITLIILILTAGGLYHQIFSYRTPIGAEVLFLPVGQGDGELIRLGRVAMLVDGGSGRTVLSVLDGLLGVGKRIDIVAISHGDSDHVGALAGVFASRDVGAVIYSGTTTSLLDELLFTLREKNIPVLTLRAGDRIVYASSSIDIIWPTHDRESVSRNDASLVFALRTKNSCALFTGDIGGETEADLVSLYGDSINCDVLKVAHHGSKYSSSAQFLNRVSPIVSVIEVGKNSYGHPTPEALARLIQAGSVVWRTDQDGLVRVIFKQQSLLVSPAKH